MKNLMAMGAHLDIILCGALPMLLTMCERIRMREFKTYRLLMHLRCKKAEMPPQASKMLSYAGIFGMPAFIYFMPVVVGQCALLIYGWILWKSMKAEKMMSTLIEKERIAWKAKVVQHSIEELELVRDVSLKLMAAQHEERVALATEMLETIKEHPELELIRESLEKIKNNN